MNNVLVHHGIKGQKWGVRNGPPYPIEDKVLKKGTRINSIGYGDSAEARRKSNRWLYTYNKDDTWDNKVYKGPFALYKMDSAQAYVHEYQYEVVSDLKMPTSKQRIDEFVNVYKDHPVQTARELENVREVLDAYGVPMDKKTKTVDFKNLKTEEDYKAAYVVLNHAMENVDAFVTTQRYAKAMSSKYDAMVDDNNVNWYNNAHDPVIIFNPSKVLKTVGEARLIDVDEVLDNYDYVKKELAKEGKRVKL